MDVDKTMLQEPPLIDANDLFVLLRMNLVTQQLEICVSPRLHKLDVLGMAHQAAAVIIQELQHERAKSGVIQLPPGARIAGRN